MFVVVAAVLLIVSRVGQGNEEADALGVFKDNIVDRQGVLDSWDTSLVNPCTWFRVTCNSDNSVIRVDLQNATLRGNLVPELARIQHLQYLELNDNMFTGSIPEELGELKELVSLDLYNNYFNGGIPESLDGLSKLKFLRLNNNMLTGSIPESLTSLSSLQVLDLSENHLSGRVPEGGVFSKMSSASFYGNDDLCGHTTGKECES